MTHRKRKKGRKGGGIPFCQKVWIGDKDTGVNQSHVYVQISNAGETIATNLCGESCLGCSSKADRYRLPCGGTSLSGTGGV